MYEYDSRPSVNQYKRTKAARKRHLKWYDGNKDSCYPKNLLRQVDIMQKLYSFDGNLYK